MEKQGELFDFNKCIELPVIKTLWEEYFNTTNLEGHRLKVATMKTGTQNRMILDIFRSHPDSLLTPFDVLNLFPWEKFNTPITSVRRSITTLTDMGYLYKTSVKREGVYGADNYCWRLKQ
jgi:Fe2+ or Zn2+ uptake regulation protein